MANEHYGIFTKESPTGQVWENTAYTPADAVKYRFDGWKLKTEGDLKTPDAAPPEKSSGGSKKETTKDK